MKKSPHLFRPQLRKYHICKEVNAVSLPDALQKEKIYPLYKFMRLMKNMIHMMTIKLPVVVRD